MLPAKPLVCDGVAIWSACLDAAAVEKPLEAEFSCSSCLCCSFTSSTRLQARFLALQSSWIVFFLFKTVKANQVSDFPETTCM